MGGSTPQIILRIMLNLRGVGGWFLGNEETTKVHPWFLCFNIARLSFLLGGGGKKPGTYCLYMHQNSQKPWELRFFCKISRMHNEHQLFYYSFVVDADNFLHENSLHWLLGWASSNPNFVEIRRIYLLTFHPVCVCEIAALRYWLVIFLHFYSIEAP